MAMYHWEADQENFLVLAGEALLVVEGEECPLRQSDFVHCLRDEARRGRRGALLGTRRTRDSQSASQRASAKAGFPIS